MGNYKVTVKHDYTLGGSPEAKNTDWPESGVLIIQADNDEFIIAGTGIVITFATAISVNKSVGILQANEGKIYKWRMETREAYEWRPGSPGQAYPNSR